MKIRWSWVMAAALLLTETAKSGVETAPGLILRCSELTLSADGTARAQVAPLNASGLAIRDLTAANFQVRVDGQAVADLAVTHSGDARTPLSVVLAIDVSGSMQGDGLAAAVRGGTGFIDQLGPRDLCCLVTFGSQVYPLLDFTTDHAALKETLAALQANDSQTVLYQTLFYAVARASHAPTIRSAVVLLTDGKDDGSRLGLSEVLAKAIAVDVPVFTLAYGLDADRETLARISAASRGASYWAPASTDVSQVCLDVAGVLHSEYLLRWHQNAADGARQRITISLLYHGERAAIDSSVRATDEGAVAAETTEAAGAGRWWWGLLGLSVAALAGGGYLWWRKRNRYEPAMAATMVPPRVWVEVVSGADSGMKAILFESDVVIGRDPVKAQVLIKSDPMVGRQHARLRQNGQGQYVIEDLKSQNGVMVNGVRISEPVILQTEDRIGIGLTEMVFTDHR